MFVRRFDNMDIFCKIINGELTSCVPFENDLVITIMDANPFKPGHLLIIPKKHYTTLLDMDDETICEINKTAKMLIRKMEEKYPNITGVSTVVNYGSEQKVKHYHMHLIPAYKEGEEPKFSQIEFCDLLKN